MGKGSGYESPLGDGALAFSPLGWQLHQGADGRSTQKIKKLGCGPFGAKGSPKHLSRAFGPKPPASATVLVIMGWSIRVEYRDP